MINRNIFALVFAFGLIGMGVLLVLLMLGVVWLASNGMGFFILIGLPFVLMFFLGRSVWGDPEVQRGLGRIVARWHAGWWQ